MLSSLLTHSLAFNSNVPFRYKNNLILAGSWRKFSIKHISSYFMVRAHTFYSKSSSLHKVFGLSPP